MAEVLHGNVSSDQLNARNDKTQVYGLAGNDTLTSGNKSDVLLVGGSGDDSLIMTGGNGTLSGGDGSDTFELTYSATKKLSVVIEDLKPSEDKIIVNFDGDISPQILSFTTTDGNVILRDNTDNLNVTVKGVRENDYFDGETINEVWNVLWLTNVEREKKNLPALTLSEGLMTGAATRVQEINGLAQTGVLNDHTRPNGEPYKTVLVDENLSLEQKYSRYGENLDGGAQVPVWVMNDWMNSKSHKDNILSKNFSKLGVGYLEDDLDPSNHRWYWTQEFAGNIKSPETISTAELLTVNPQVNTVLNFIAGTDDADTINNGNNGATIEALGGGDSISNTGLLVSISSGADNDTINNRGSFVTVNGGTGDDRIRLSADSKGNVIEYSASDGNDTVYGFDNADTLKIYNDDYQYRYFTDGNDFVVKSGESSITLVDAAKSFINFHFLDTKYIVGSANADSIENWYDSVIYGNDGNDTINNHNTNVVIHDDDGNDYITNDAASVGIDCGIGNDTIDNSGSIVVIRDYYDGNDYVRNSGDSVSIDSGIGDDIVSNYGSNVTILGGDGNDDIYNDHIAVSVNIDGGIGNDTVVNIGSNVTINADTGDDYIYNDASFVSIDCGIGDDTIVNFGSNVTINVGIGNDRIDFYPHTKNNLIQYVTGDGSDIVTGFDESDTISIFGGEYTPITINNDIFLEVDDGYIILSDAANLSSVNIKGKKSRKSKLITLTENNDTLENYELGATIQALGSDDTIYNESPYVTVDCGDGNDLVYNYTGGEASITTGEGNDTIISSYSWYVTVNGGAGNDSISLSSDSRYNVIEYANGDGNDTVWGFNESYRLFIANDKYTPQTVGSDIVIAVGTDSITLVDSATLSSIQIITTYNNTIDGATIQATDKGDSINNYGSNVFIDGGVGNDTIANGNKNSLGGSFVTINGEADDDNIDNFGSNVTINAGTGNDFIYNGSDKVIINAGAGDDTVVNNGSNVTINAGTGDASIYNGSDKVIINAGAGDDTIDNRGSNVTINTGTGNNTVYSDGDSVSIDGSIGNDTINNFGSNITINSSTGDDFVYNDKTGDSVSIDCGIGNDYISNLGSDVTILGGDGNDYVYIREDAKNNLILYTPGDGNDTIEGTNETYTLKILTETASIISSTLSGNDVIYTVGENTILLKGGRDNPPHVIIGESGTSGGGSSSGNNGGGGSSSGGGGGRGGNDGGNTSGGTSANEGRGSDASGGRSAVGSVGRGTTGTDSGSSGGGNVRVSSSRSGSRIASSTNFAEFMNGLMPSTQQTTTQPTANQRIYAGGNQIVSDYQSGEKIVFSEVYMGSFYDGAGNYCVGSSTGALVIQNAMDKVIDLSDVAGNDFVKAYAATTAGVIDGRGLAGFEIINGSAGADAIFAGDGGSQLWGGADYVQDIMVGGGGTDIFISGRTQGADIVLNASSTDIVHLNDATLSDIIATEENNGVIAVAFNTGNVIAVQSSEALSATFMLTDGSMYRFNHVTKNWQTT